MIVLRSRPLPASVLPRWKQEQERMFRDRSVLSQNISWLVDFRRWRRILTVAVPGL